ncbi:MAG: hypothetical protein LBQ90_01955 [Synergistaceae bacterium]|jgi:hypothetical protein|nr:hypothetical protein [Synergistaceae bacterium]
MFLGSLWCLNERYAWMSLRGYRLTAGNSFVEKRFWDVFPAESLRFWPSFLQESQNVASFLERTIPVEVRTQLTGFGTFSTTVSLLSPWLLVEWRGQTWCISREGRMWSTADEDARIGGLRIPEKPLWRIASSDSSGVDEAPLPRGVFSSLFPVNIIENFLEGFGKASWFENVREIALERRAGADLFRLHYVSEERKYTILIQRNRSGWQELNTALEHILKRLPKDGGSRLIDATYENRIVVRALSEGAGEGSSK